MYHVGKAHTDILHSYNLFCSFVFTPLFSLFLFSFSCCAGEPWWTNSYGHPTVLQHLHNEYAATDHRPHRPDPGLPHTSLQPHPRPGVLWPEWNNRLAPLRFVSLDIHTKWETFCREPFSLQLMYCNHITLRSNHFTAPFVLHPVLLRGIPVDGFAHFLAIITSFRWRALYKLFRKIYKFKIKMLLCLLY